MRVDLKAMRSVAVPGARIFATLALGSSIAAGQPRTGILSGIVTNLNGVVLPRAEVIIANTDLKAVTNDSGVYVFAEAPAGKVRVIARRIGFEPFEQRITLEDGKPKQLDFELKGLPEKLDSVMIREANRNGRLSDFWSRRMIGVGAFLTHDEIEKRRAQRSSDLLRTITGVHVVMGEGGFDRPQIVIGRNPVTLKTGAGRSGSTFGSDCHISYYVDGNYVPSGTFHMDDISPLALEAVEIYRGPSETPAKLRQRDTACGVIVLWTRDAARREPGGAE